MIKCEDSKKECVIIGEEKEILFEFGVICYGMIRADYDVERLLHSLQMAYEKSKEDKKRKEKRNGERENENIKKDIL